MGGSSFLNGKSTAIYSYIVQLDKSSLLNIA